MAKMCRSVWIRTRWQPPFFDHPERGDRPSARPRSGSQIGAHVQSALGIGNLNALLPKQAPDLIENLALDVVDPVHRTRTGPKRPHEPPLRPQQAFVSFVGVSAQT